jgi:hypothetical protein
VQHAALRLHAVEIGRPQHHEGAPPRLFGTKPAIAGRREIHPGAWRYQRLNIPIAFTGRLLVGHGPVDMGRLHMGFRPAWLYRTVQELTFRRGHLTAVKNRSAVLATVRQRLGPHAVQPASGDTRREWIGQSFSLGYAYSWPGSEAAHRSARSVAAAGVTRSAAER